MDCRGRLPLAGLVCVNVGNLSRQLAVIGHRPPIASLTGEQILPRASTPITQESDFPATGRRQSLARLCQRSRTLPLLQGLRGLWRNDLRILAYHRVLESAPPGDFTFDLELVSATAEGFRQQMSLLRQRLQPISFAEAIDCLQRNRPLPKGAVLVTFDDGYDDNYRVAFPILRELGMSAMFFVSTRHIDTGAPYAYDWLVHMLCTTGASELALPELETGWALPADTAARRALAVRLLDQMKTLDADAQEALIRRLEREWNLPRTSGHAHCRPMDWTQLREMRDAGMEVGSHGVAHRMLAKLPEADMREEVTGSLAALRRELRVAPQVISYPVGGADAFDDKVMEAVRDAGFALGCSYIVGTSLLSQRSRYALRRLPVERDMDLGWFEAMLALPEVFSYGSRLRKRHSVRA